MDDIFEMQNTCQYMFIPNNEIMKEIFEAIPMDMFDDTQRLQYEKSYKVEGKNESPEKQMSTGSFSDKQRKSPFDLSFKIKHKKEDFFTFSPVQTSPPQRKNTTISLTEETKRPFKSKMFPQMERMEKISDIDLSKGSRLNFQTQNEKLKSQRSKSAIFLADEFTPFPKDINKSPIEIVDISNDNSLSYSPKSSSYNDITESKDADDQTNEPHNDFEKPSIKILFSNLKTTTSYDKQRPHSITKDTSSSTENIAPILYDTTINTRRPSMPKNTEDSFQVSVEKKLLKPSSFTSFNQTTVDKAKISPLLFQGTLSKKDEFLADGSIPDEPQWIKHWIVLNGNSLKMYPCDSNITDTTTDFQIKRGIKSSFGNLFSFKKKNPTLSLVKNRETYKCSTPDLPGSLKIGSLKLKGKLRKSIGDLFSPLKTEFNSEDINITSEESLGSEEEKLFGYGSLLNTISVSKIKLTLR
jgi:hypothetical protein